MIQSPSVRGSDIGQPWIKCPASSTNDIHSIAVRPQIAAAQTHRPRSKVINWQTGAREDEVPQRFTQRAQRAAVGEPAPPSITVGKDAALAVGIREPNTAPGIQIEAPHTAFMVKEPPAVKRNDQ